MWLYLFGLTLGLGYLYLWNVWQYWKRRGVNGPSPSLLGMGNTVEMFSGLGDKSKGIPKWNNEFGEIYGIFGMWTAPTIIINDPEAAKGEELEIFIR